MIFWSSDDFFQNNFFKYYFRNTIRVSSHLDLGQAHSVGPHRGPNGLQRSAADNKISN